MALSLGACLERRLGSEMEINEILQIADTSGTMLFAILVWIELRKVREEIVSVLHRIDGFIQGKE